jgi:hypothetical protein
LLEGKGCLDISRRRPKKEGDIKMELREEFGRVWVGFIWLSIGTDGELL